MKKRTYASSYLISKDSQNHPRTTTTNSRSLNRSGDHNNITIFHDIEDTGTSSGATTAKGAGESTRDNEEKKKDQKSLVSPARKILIKILVAIIVGVVVVVVSVGLSTITTSSKDRLLSSARPSLSQTKKTHVGTEQSSPAVLSPKAYPVYGTRIVYHGDSESNTLPIEVVYAFPPPPPPHQQRSSSSSVKVKGLVVLLHACTHSALKFFSPSAEKCPTCVGLAEEMEIVRQILQRNYAAVAITSSNRQNGFWNLGDDVRRVQIAIKQFIKDHPEEFSKSSQSSSSSSSSSYTKIFAVGTSSGGTIASKLFAKGIVDGAFSGVMAISQPKIMDQIVKRLSTSSFPAITKSSSKPNVSSSSSSSSSSSLPLVYIAPMPKDHGTTRQSKEGYGKMLQQIQQSLANEQHDNQNHDLESQRAVLLEEMLFYDDTSCTELSVTAQYLYDHVYGMTKDGAQTIVDALVTAHYLDSNEGPDRQKLIKDPTRTPWREVLLQIPPPSSILELPAEFLGTVKLRKNNLSSTSTKQQDRQQRHPQTFLWDVYELTPGYSSLAKALHRAWAYHEYCSEAVGKALDMYTVDSEA